MAAAALPTPSTACSRVLWPSKAGVRVGRTLDWFEDVASTLWALPAGVNRTGGGARPLTWTATHGSLANYIYDDLASVEGLNERGFSCQVERKEEGLLPPQPGLGREEITEEGVHVFFF